jgi:hypothetical protein
VQSVSAAESITIRLASRKDARCQIGWRSGGTAWWPVGRITDELTVVANLVAGRENAAKVRRKICGSGPHRAIHSFMIMKLISKPSQRFLARDEG